MKRLPVLTQLVLGLAILFTPAIAGAEQIGFSCHTPAGGESFCTYTGPVYRLYVNDPSDLLLFYWDPSVTSLVLDAASTVGIEGVTAKVAGAVRYRDDPDFANHFSSYVLAAQLTGRSVTLQMRGSLGGYLTIDRVWLR